MKKLVLKDVKEVSLPVTIFKEGKSYVAYSPALDLSTSASTYKKAQSRFLEIVELFLEELEEAGTLDAVLTGLCWQKVNSAWLPPVVVSNYVQSMNLSYA